MPSGMLPDCISVTDNAVLLWITNQIPALLVLTIKPSNRLNFVSPEPLVGEGNREISE